MTQTKGAGRDLPGAALCAACRHPLAYDGRFCEACGATASADVRPAPVPAAASGTVSESCRTCGAPELTPERYCLRCGRLQSLIPEHLEVDFGVAAGVSDRGLRHRHNQDAIALRHLPPSGNGTGRALAVICDGVSSITRSDEAAVAAAEAGADAMVAALSAQMEADTATRQAIAVAMDAVVALANGADERAPACTYVSAVVGSGSVTVGWVGDSRAYWLPDQRQAVGRALQLTEDDSWLVRRAGRGASTSLDLTSDWRAHAITAWLGAGAGRLDPHVVTHELNDSGVVVVCTDGLWNYLAQPDVLAAAIPIASAPLDAARELVRVALEAGGRDNVTVAVLPVSTTDQEEHP